MKNTNLDLNLNLESDTSRNLEDFLNGSIGIYGDLNITSSKYRLLFQYFVGEGDKNIGFLISFFEENFTSFKDIDKNNKDYLDTFISNFNSSLQAGSIEVFEKYIGSYFSEDSKNNQFQNVIYLLKKFYSEKKGINIPENEGLELVETSNIVDNIGSKVSEKIGTAISFTKKAFSFAKDGYLKIEKNSSVLNNLKDEIKIKNSELKDIQEKVSEIHKDISKEIFENTSGVSYDEVSDEMQKIEELNNKIKNIDGEDFKLDLNLLISNGIESFIQEKSDLNGINFKETFEDIKNYRMFIENSFKNYQKGIETRSQYISNLIDYTKIGMITYNYIYVSNLMGNCSNEVVKKTKDDLINIFNFLKEIDPDFDIEKWLKYSEGIKNIHNVFLSFNENDKGIINIKNNTQELQELNLELNKHNENLLSFGINPKKENILKPKEDYIDAEIEEENQK